MPAVSEALKDNVCLFFSIANSHQCKHMSKTKAKTCRKPNMSFYNVTRDQTQPLTAGLDTKSTWTHPIRSVKACIKKNTTRLFFSSIDIQTS